MAAKNALKSYAFEMKLAVEDEKVKKKINWADRKRIRRKCEKVIRWLDGHQQAEKEEYEHKQKELESVWNSIIAKMHQDEEMEEMHYSVPVYVYNDSPRETFDFGDLFWKFVSGLISYSVENCLQNRWRI